MGSARIQIRVSSIRVSSIGNGSTGARSRLRLVAGPQRRAAASASPLRVVLIGPPGAGKGTQAERLRDGRRLAHISTGDMLRDEVRRGTPLGLEARESIAQGRLVSDDLMLAMIESRLQQPDCAGGFILDGFPRSAAQARALQALLERRGLPLSGVVLLELDDEIIVERLTQRRICPGCGSVYHLRSHPPQHEGVCDRDGARLLHREDDCESVIRQRLGVYHAQTEPVVRFFQQLARVERIDASLPIAQVELQVESAVARFKGILAFQTLDKSPVGVGTGLY